VTSVPLKTVNGLTTPIRLQQTAQSAGHAQSLRYFTKYKGYVQWSGHRSRRESTVSLEGPVIAGVGRWYYQASSKARVVRSVGQRLSSHASVTACHRQTICEFRAVERNPRVQKRGSNIRHDLTPRATPLPFIKDSTII